MSKAVGMTDRLDVQECELSPTIWLYRPGLPGTEDSADGHEDDQQVELCLDEHWFIIDHYIAILEPLEVDDVITVTVNLVTKPGRFAPTRPGSGVALSSPQFEYTIKEPRPLGVRIDFHEDLADWEFADIIRKRYPKVSP